MAERAPWEDDPIVIPAEELQGKPRAVAGPDTGGNPWDADPIVKPAPREKQYLDNGVRESMEGELQKRARKMRGAKDPGKLQSFGLGFTDWGGMSFGDELTGLMGAGFSYLPGAKGWGDESFGERYDLIKKRYEDTSDMAWEQHPWLYGAGATLGGVASAAITPEVRAGQGALATAYALPATNAAELAARTAAVRAAERRAATLTGGATGAVWGGISGAGQGDSLTERAANAVVGGVVGGVGGGLLARGADNISARIRDRGIRKAMEDTAADAFGAEASARGIRTSRGQRTGDVYTQARENGMIGTAEGPKAAEVGQAFKAGQYDDIGNALDDIGGKIAGQHPVIREPHEGGAILKDSIQARANADAQGATIGNLAEQRSGQAAADAMELGFGRGAQLVDNEVDAGEMVARRVREEQARSAANRDAAYEAAANVNARIGRGAIDGMDQRIMEDLTYNRQQPVIVNEQTPSAREALKIISDVSEFRAPRNMADPQGMPDPATITHVDPRGIESVRKRLVALSQDARQRAMGPGGNGTDYHATRSILAEFDNQLERAVQYGLFEGDPAWLDAYRNARSLHARHRATYRPEDDLRSAMRAIVERDATPEQVANYLLGRSRLGDTPVAARLSNHLRDVLGDTSEEWAAIKQAAWQKLLTTGSKERETRAVTADTAERIASQIQEFTTRRGRSFAESVFSPQELTLMNRYANRLRTMAANQHTPNATLQEMAGVVHRDINPQRVAEIVTGNTKAQGKGDTSWLLVQQIEDVYGRDSQEWSTVRQMVWRQLVGVPDGKDPKGAKLLSSNILDFVNGPGAPSARRLFSADERKEMLAIAHITKRIAGSADAKNPPGSAWQLGRILQERGRQFMTGLGFIAGGTDAGITAWIAGQGSKMVADEINGRNAQRLFTGQRPMSATGVIKDKGDAMLLRNARRGSLGTPVVGGHEVGPALTGAVSNAIAGDEQRPQ